MGFTVGWEYRSRVTRKWYQLLRRSFCSNKAASSPTMIWGERCCPLAPGESLRLPWSQLEQVVWKLSSSQQRGGSLAQEDRVPAITAPKGSQRGPRPGLASHRPCRETPGEDWRQTCCPAGAAHIPRASAATSAPALLVSACYQAKGRHAVRRHHHTSPLCLTNLFPMTQ